MEKIETLQMLIGDLTLEQFFHVLGVAFGIFTVSSFVVFIVFCFLNSYENGRLHYKTKEYYGSFRYLNKRFNALKTASRIDIAEICYYELRSAIMLLKFQGVIPMFLYMRLIDKCQEIFENHLIEVSCNEDN